MDQKLALDALRQRIQEFLADDPSRQTLEAAKEIKGDPMYKALTKANPGDPLVDGRTIHGDHVAHRTTPLPQPWVDGSLPAWQPPGPDRPRPTRCLPQVAPDPT